jgi:predicted amidohydrolase
LHAGTSTKFAIGKETSFPFTTVNELVFRRTMKICIAQTLSIKGGIKENIQNHLQMINRAVSANADLIIFPELSITGYEPRLARSLALNLNSSILDSFQEISDAHEISIGVGMPTNTAGEIQISMLIFEAFKERVSYSKQRLHKDETPYFKEGNHQVFINIKGLKLALGICYETLDGEHFLKCKNKGADIYIASVAKSESGIKQANSKFPQMAQEYQIPILMSNAVGFCDNFLSLGESAVWNQNGELQAQLNRYNQGLIFYDTASNRAEIDQLKIELAQPDDLGALFQMYKRAKIELDKQKLFQWTDNYPTAEIIEGDLKKESLYTLKEGDEIIGAICLSEEQDPQYQYVNWKYNHSKVLVIHRLVIHPKHQRKSHALKLMDFAEHYAIDHNYSSIRLDAYSANARVVNFYKKRDYRIRGAIYFAERKHPFHCMEKHLKAKS